MKRDEYWERLVNRHYKEKENFTGFELEYWQIRHLCGEIWVNGVIGYFDQFAYEYHIVRTLLLRGNFLELVNLLDNTENEIFKGRAATDQKLNEEPLSAYLDFMELNDSNSVDSQKQEVLNHIDKVDKWIEELAIQNKLYES